MVRLRRDSLRSCDQRSRHRTRSRRNSTALIIPLSDRSRDDNPNRRYSRPPHSSDRCLCVGVCIWMLRRMSQ
jgi:hypothetical protein